MGVISRDSGVAHLERLVGLRLAFPTAFALLLKFMKPFNATSAFFPTTCAKTASMLLKMLKPKYLLSSRMSQGCGLLRYWVTSSLQQALISTHCWHKKHSTLMSLPRHWPSLSAFTSGAMRTQRVLG